jgi:hypothetical protein
MKKSFLAFIIVFIAVANGLAVGPIQSTGLGDAAPTESYSDITFWWRCETSTLTTGDYSAGDTTAALNGANLSTDANKTGTNGLLCQTGENAYFEISSGDLASIIVGSAAVWFKLAAAPAGNIIWMLNTSTGADGQIFLQAQATGELRFNIWNGTSDQQLVTNGAGLTTGAWYFAVARWDTDNNKRFVAVYNASGTLLASAEDLSTDITPPVASFVRLYLGDTEGTSQYLYIDQIFGLSTDYSRDWLSLRDRTTSPK